jgi:hypothetical protein
MNRLLYKINTSGVDLFCYRVTFYEGNILPCFLYIISFCTHSHFRHLVCMVPKQKWGDVFHQLPATIEVIGYEQHFQTAHLYPCNLEFTI